MAPLLVSPSVPRIYGRDECRWVVSASAPTLGAALSELIAQSGEAEGWLLRSGAEPEVRFEASIGGEHLSERAFFERAATLPELRADVSLFVRYWSTLTSGNGGRLYAWHDDLRPASYYAAFSLALADVACSETLEIFLSGIDPLYPVFLPRPLLTYFERHGWRPETLRVLARACAHGRRGESDLLRAAVFHLRLREHLLESALIDDFLRSVLERNEETRDDDDAALLKSQLFVEDDAAYHDWRDRQQELIERWQGRTALGRLAGFAAPGADWDVL